MQNVDIERFDIQEAIKTKSAKINVYRGSGGSYNGKIGTDKPDK